MIVYGTQWIVYGTSSSVGHAIVHGTHSDDCSWDLMDCLFMGLKQLFVYGTQEASDWCSRILKVTSCLTCESWGAARDGRSWQ